MKINYNFKSNALTTINIFGVFIFLGFFAILSSIANVPNLDEFLIVIIVSGIIVVPIIWVSLIILFSNMPMEMVADEEKLNIKVLFRENAIRYSDIARINLDREFQEATTRGEHDGYYEKLIITDINNNEYVYCRKLDLDYDAIAKNPAYLASQFENSEFAKLKRYIEERIPIMNAEKI